ncbi:MAG TPA: porin, partial [Longimicrobiales bacterium]|nr:porin [Longimicrobiales bacterium]
MKTIQRWLSPVGVSIIAAALAATPSAAQQISVGGVVYSQYEYLLSDPEDHGNAFDVKRAYVDVRGRFEGGIATRVTSDIHRQSDGSLAFRLKYAYFTWTPEDSPVTLKFGQIHTVWLDWEEGLWDYRMQGTMPIERYGYTASSDLGVGLDGSWGGEKLNVQVAAQNGEGYHAAEGDKHKDVAGR